MTQQVAENVALIKTIPPRFHDGLRKRLMQHLQSKPFDQQAVAGMLRDQFNASGNQLRLLARDQTTKTIGGLTRVRHTELGIRSIAG